MERNDFISYWIESSEKDYITMKNLYHSGDYHWALFIGHLVLEKLLKALYVKNVGEKIPYTHDLLRLANDAASGVPLEMADQLDFITTFNINTRYPDYKQEFYKKCTKEFTQDNLKKIEGIREWIKLMIDK